MFEANLTKYINLSRQGETPRSPNLQRLNRANTIRISDQGAYTFAPHNHGVSGMVQVPSSGSANIELDDGSNIKLVFQRPPQSTKVKVRLGNSAWLNTDQLPVKFRNELSQIWAPHKSSVLMA